MTLTPQVPALVVLVPLLAGVVIGLVRHAGLAWLLASLASVTTFALTLALAARVQAEGVVVYAMGGWAAPTGIELRVDALNALVLALVAGMAAVIVPTSRASVAREVPADRHDQFYALLLLCVAGMLGVTATGDAFNLYVLIEISSLTAYALVALGRSRDRRALTASFQYLIMGSIGASFLLVGLGYLFLATGTLNMADMAVRLADLHGSTTVRTGVAFVIVGLSLKMALFPVHQWMADAYTYAPTAVTALMASTATKVGVYITIRFVYTIFGHELSFVIMPTDAFLLAFACLAIIVGSLQAIRQHDVRRLLAYSSVAQIGYLVLGLALGSALGLSGTLVHLLNHALVKGALFLAVGAVVYRQGGATMHELTGIARRMPLTAAAIAVGGLGLIGVPLTGGFVSKWYLVAGALEAGLWPVAVVVLVGSLLAVAYVLRLLQVVYFGEPGTVAPEPAGEAPASFWAPALLLLLGSVALGVNGQLTGGLIAAAAGALAGGAP